MASLSYCIDLTHSLHHTHTHASIAKITSLFLQSQSHSCAFIPRFISSALQPAKSSTQLQTESYDSLITAVQTHSLYVHVCICIHTEHRRLSRTQCMHDPVSARCIAGYCLCSSRSLSPRLVFCLFTSLVASSLSFSLSAATVKPSILCSHCGRDCVEQIQRQRRNRYVQLSLWL